jgi:hypothetical protein
MPITLYHRESDLGLDDPVLSDALSIAPWIRFRKAYWPVEGYFGGGFAAGNIRGKVLEGTFVEWARSHLRTPAIILTGKPIEYSHSRTITGATLKELPLVVVTNRFLSGTEIPSDVQRSSLVHELVHMARNLVTRLDPEEVDENGHCRSERCVLSFVGGEADEDFLSRVRERPIEPCAKCRFVLEEVRDRGDWK